MGTGKITFFCICAVIVLGTLTASASLGPSGLVLWAIAVIFFVIPNMMITSELGTTYPAEGGIYDWIRRAFGKRMSTRAVYLYWISNGIWMGANYILLTGLISSGFMGGKMPLWLQLPLVIALIWLTVAFICYKVSVGVWATVGGATCKILIMSTVGIGGFWYASKYGVANEFTLETLTPSADSGIGFFSAIIYNVTGFELVACMGKVLKDPAKTMPKAILFSSLSVVALYVFGSLGILMAIPVGQINLVSGIADAVSPIFGQGSFIVMLILVLFMLTILGDQITWSMAPSRAAAEAARGGSLPAFIGKWHPRYQSPYGANIVLGCIGTVVSIIYSFFAAGNAADTFWSLFSFSSTCIISSYLLYYSAFMKLRLADPDTTRPYKVPGGRLMAWGCTLICLLFISICITLFIFPQILSGKVNLNHSGPIVVGMILILIIGEIIIRRSEKSYLLAGGDKPPAS
ncbi:MAG: APC family permease [Puniceicoccales bacterium]|nr:APC family permease [Puniceicoccales bacterium]